MQGAVQRHVLPCSSSEHQRREQVKQKAKGCSPRLCQRLTRCTIQRQTRPPLALSPFSSALLLERSPSPLALILVRRKYGTYGTAANSCRAAAAHLQLQTTGSCPLPRGSSQASREKVRPPTSWVRKLAACCLLLQGETRVAFSTASCLSSRVRAERSCSVDTLAPKLALDSTRASRK